MESLHPDGLFCPKGHRLSEGQGAHDRHRAPVLDYRCRECGAVYNLFTHTILKGIRWPCSTVILMLRGFAQGTPTNHLAQELGVERIPLWEWRHRVQTLLSQRLSPSALVDAVIEADEMYQNAGEKGLLPPDPTDPPRRRANKQRGQGTWDNHRPPIAGLVGRESGQIRLRVLEHSDRKELEAFVVGKTVVAVRVHSEEWRAYDHLPETGRARMGG